MSAKFPGLSSSLGYVTRPVTFLLAKMSFKILSSIHILCIYLIQLHVVGGAASISTSRAVSLQQRSTLVLELFCFKFGLNSVILICLYTVATRSMGRANHAAESGSIA